MSSPQPRSGVGGVVLHRLQRDAAVRDGVFMARLGGGLWRLGWNISYWCGLLPQLLVAGETTRVTLSESVWLSGTRGRRVSASPPAWAGAASARSPLRGADAMEDGAWAAVRLCLFTRGGCCRPTARCAVRV